MLAVTAVPRLPKPRIRSADRGLGPLIRDIAPWPEPVDGRELLNDLSRLLTEHVVLPGWAAHTLALWCLHTYAFELRDVGTYIGIESPEKRCGKTTLLGVLGRLVRRPVVAANISSPAFFRVIEELRPTLLIDEADTFLERREELRGILNAGYHRESAYVIRVCPTPGASEAGGNTLGRFSCWCPKVMCLIGRFPDTLADRCIVIRMHRKRREETCKRLRGLQTEELRQKCARFVLDYAERITGADPDVPEALNDRAGDVWEPLLSLAEVAGGEWPERARRAALGLTAGAQESHPIASLLFDAFVELNRGETERIFSRDLVRGLSGYGERPWRTLTARKELTEAWLAECLRPYGIKPVTMRIGDEVGRGYTRAEIFEAMRRYVPKAEVLGFLDELKSRSALAEAAQAAEIERERLRQQQSSPAWVSEHTKALLAKFAPRTKVNT